MDWQSLEEHFGSCFSEEGRPAINTRLMISLHYLKYANNLSDEETVLLWVENPYWQYFGGMIYFGHSLPIHPSSMSRWKTRIGEKGAEALLKQTIDNALKLKLVKPEQLSRINVDTTVSQNNTAFPTDARLYNRAIQLLVKESRRDNLTLRRTYIHVSKRTLIQSQRYAHARQMKRAAKQVKKLRTMLGNLIRDIERKTSGKLSPYMLIV
ncbi:MAG: transposase, partial [Akkermansia sp.]